MVGIVVVAAWAWLERGGTTTGMQWGRRRWRGLGAVNNPPESVSEGVGVGFSAIVGVYKKGLDKFSGPRGNVVAGCELVNGVDRAWRDRWLWRVWWCCGGELKGCELVGDLL
jgi:hypothetical protein